MQKRDVVLYFSYRPERTAPRAARFAAELRDKCPAAEFCILTYDQKQSECKRHIVLDHMMVVQWIYNKTSTARLGYPNKVGTSFSLKPLNCDVPVLLFWRDNQNFERYWVVEDDVEYTGNFGKLILELGALRADLLATHIRHLPTNWDYISKFRTDTTCAHISDSNRLSFLPFHAISNSGLAAIDAAYRNGWAGQHEMTWPAILDDAGLRIEDIGGNGPWVAIRNRGRHYIDASPSDYQKLGSFGTKQIRMRAGRQENILWHPVKTLPDWIKMKWKRSLSVVDWTIDRLAGRV